PPLAIEPAMLTRLVETVGQSIQAATGASQATPLAA
ncbi:MAG: hypothetical protein QOI65_459, partial [Thermoleophilaceae bacterium]|nr:hypothetical protein [Thermoleophilaceae bacterium]